MFGKNKKNASQTTATEATPITPTADGPARPGAPTPAEEPIQPEVTEVTATTEATVTESGTSNKKNAKKDLILYIIIDKSNESLLPYYRDHGIKVSKIFTNINDAKDTLLMQINPVKVLIVDTGTGRFSAMGSRKELIDLMGICDDDVRISVYYTDTVIKSEIKYNEGFASRDIHWHKFKSNTDVAAHLLRNFGRENYIYDPEDVDKVKEVQPDALNFKGLNFEEPRHYNAGEPSITINDVKIHMVENQSTDGEVESYNILKI